MESEVATGKQSYTSICLPSLVQCAPFHIHEASSYHCSDELPGRRELPSRHQTCVDCRILIFERCGSATPPCQRRKRREVHAISRLLVFFMHVTFAFDSVRLLTGNPGTHVTTGNFRKCSSRYFSVQ